MCASSEYSAEVIWKVFLDFISFEQVGILPSELLGMRPDNWPLSRPPILRMPLMFDFPSSTSFSHR